MFSFLSLGGTKILKLWYKNFNGAGIVWNIVYFVASKENYFSVNYVLVSSLLKLFKQSFFSFFIPTVF